MSEVNDGQEPNLSEDFRNIMESQVGGSYLSLIKFDEFRGTLYASLAELPLRLDEISSRGKSEVVDIEDFRQRFGDLLRDMLKDDASPDNIIETASLLIKSDSDERVNLICTVLDDNNAVQKFTLDNLRQLVTDTVRGSDTVSHAIENIATHYGGTLGNDIGTYIQRLVHEHSHSEYDENETSSTSALEIKKTPKDHIVDVAKIAAGVALALGVDRFLRRRRS